MSSNTVAIAQGYANALYEIAQSKASLEEVYTDLKKLSEALHSVPELEQALMHIKNLTLEEATSFVMPFVTELHPYIQNTVKVMLDASHAEGLISLYEAFLPSYQAFKGIGYVHVGTAVELTDETQTTIKKRLKVLFKLQKVHLIHHIEPDLLGGLYVEYRGIRLDASLKRKLSNLETHISQV